MKDAEFEATCDRCKALIVQWSTMLGLGWWEIEENYYDDQAEFQKDNGHVVAARCHADWQYIRATLDVCAPVVAEFDDDKLERTIVHELCHALVHEMRETDPDGKHEERVVTQLTKAFLWTRDLTAAPATSENGKRPDMMEVTI